MTSFLNKDGAEVKITDFNVSKFDKNSSKNDKFGFKQEKIRMLTYTGTIAFSAPEMFEGTEYTWVFPLIFQLLFPLLFPQLSPLLFPLLFPQLFPLLFQLLFNLCGKFFMVKFENLRFLESLLTCGAQEWFFTRCYADISLFKPNSR